MKIPGEVEDVAERERRPPTSHRKLCIFVLYKKKNKLREKLAENPVCGVS